VLSVPLSGSNLAFIGSIASLVSLSGNEGEQILHQLAESLGNAVDARDSDTFNHSWEVAEFSRMIAESLGLPEKQREAVHLAGHLHDIGKIGISDAILRKKGKLSSEEWTQMKRHPDIGDVILRPIKAFAARGGVADMVLFHHERFDGTGYPQGLKGYQIPLGARIIAAADTLSALLQNRPYRGGTSFEEALREIRSCAGTQFDPAIVGALGRVSAQLSEFARENRDLTATPCGEIAPLRNNG
jgi:HD-GYP domain-containing protein (c-di-GMP phosphodiesterase class II)